MIIKLSPVRSDESLAVFRLGDLVTINNVAFDFSPLTDGATIPAEAIGSSFLLDQVARDAGRLVLTLRLPHAADAPHEARFPVDMTDPPDGPVSLPGLETSAPTTFVGGAIDWSQMITAEQKAQAAADQLLAAATADIAQRRIAADAAVAPLQDAVDLDIATDAEAALLKEWKRYRVALNRLPDQPGYPGSIDWPAPPA